ncbi:MAG: DUF3180 domain-containing protein [Nakamurella sp.]
MADENRMGFTRPRDLLVVTVIAVVLGYLLVRLSYQRIPPLPRFAGVAAALLGIGEAIAGFGIRSRIQSPRGGASPGQLRKPVPPLTAARAVMAAKATSLAGAAVAGLWLGLLLYVLPSWSEVAAARSDGITAIIGLVGAVIMIGGALFLEYCCRAPDFDR